MKLLVKLVPLGALICFNAHAIAPVKGSVSPWGPPDRSVDLGSEQQRAQLKSDMQPCIESAKKTVPEALRRYRAREFRRAKFFAVILADKKVIAYIDVKKVKKDKVYGRVDTRNIKAGQKYYMLDNKIELRSEDIVDWYVLYKDRPPEGNLLGRYLLQRMDGLVSGACNPDHQEFQQYRVFTRTYSFVPPGTDGWEMSDRAPETDLSMQQNIGDLDELNTLSGATYRNIPAFSDQELIEYVRSYGRYGSEEGVRYNVVKLEAEIFPKPGVRCASSRHTVEDNQALLSRSGKRGFMIRDVETLMCVHPVESGVVIVLNYSHRHHPGKRDPKFTDKANRVFESIAFKQSVYGKAK